MKAAERINSRGRTRGGSSGRVPALQAQSPEFITQSHKKKMRGRGPIEKRKRKKRVMIKM
jgi:hypothetical protein